jgi:2-polyprenyl-3-methyl-5-hydroxy-6-metoxy-1,4-benzoquinol methylase
MKNLDYLAYLSETKSFYDEKFGQSNGAELNDEEKRRWLQIENCLKKITPAIKGDSFLMLDYGCGDGRFAPFLCKYGKSIGVDISALSIQKAKRHYPSCEFQICDLSSNEVLEKIKSRFDVIVSTEVIEHIYDQETYLKNAKILLKDNGRLILTTPNGKCFSAYFSNGNDSSGQAFEWWLTKEELISQLSNSGFQVESFHTFFNNWVFYRYPQTNLRWFFNRYSMAFLRKIGLEKLVEKIIEKLGFGLYQIVVAQKT